MPASKCAVSHVPQTARNCSAIVSMSETSRCFLIKVYSFLLFLLALLLLLVRHLLLVAMHLLLVAMHLEEYNGCKMSEYSAPLCRTGQLD